MKNFIYLIIISFSFILSSCSQKKFDFSTYYESETENIFKVNGTIIIKDQSIFLEMRDKEKGLSKTMEFEIINKNKNRYYVQLKCSDNKCYFEKINKGWEIHQENGSNFIRLQ
jgi:hypothetical protein